MTPLRLAFFDLDDTAYDRSSLRPQSLLRELRSWTSRVSSERALSRNIEAVRRAGPVFAMLGLPDLYHDADSPAMIAALRVLYGHGRPPRAARRSAGSGQAAARRALARVAPLADPEPAGDWRRSLQRELRFHQAVDADPLLHDVAALVRRVAAEPATRELAQQARRAGTWNVYEGFRRSWAALEEAGVRCFIASEGQTKRQAHKLQLLDLGPEFRQRMITTQRAASPPGAEELRKHVRALLRAAVRERGRRGGEPPLAALPPELVQLYPFVWALARFGRKEDRFFARALHAAILAPADPGKALDGLGIVPRERWLRSDVRLAMIGDRYTKDIAPIESLLGDGVPWTALLRVRRNGSGRPAERRRGAAHRFDSWEGLSAALRRGEPWSEARRIRRRPELVARGALGRRELQAGLRSRFAVVRRLARALAS